MNPNNRHPPDPVTENIPRLESEEHEDLGLGPELLGRLSRRCYMNSGDEEKS